MKIIKCEKLNSESVNFIDENNVLLGWDDTEDCCEDFRWWISNRIHTLEELETEIPENAFILSNKRKAMK